MVARLLTREGHTVTEAVDGVVAVSMVSRTLIDRTPTPEGAAPSAAPGGTRASHKAGPVHFDAVLMDGNMPRCPYLAPIQPPISPLCIPYTAPPPHRPHPSVRPLSRATSRSGT